MSKEEELKRLHQQASSSYGQVQFDYNKSEQATTATGKDSLLLDENKSDEASDELFIPPANFNIPETIVTPETMKLNAIIEKTAKFISSQGSQMEILIKAKQSNNPQFEFLNANNRLNPYYKFVLESFKNGTYPLATSSNQQDGGGSVAAAGDTKNLDLKIFDSQQNAGNSVQNNFFYPSISTVVPAIKYKPSANCAYTQLISKIKGLPLPPENQSSIEESTSTPSPPVPPPAPPLEEITPPTLLTTHHSQATVSYAANAGGDGVEETTPENNATVVALTPPPTQPLVATIKSNNHHDESSSDDKIREKINKEGGVEIKKISTALALAQCYASDTEEETDCSTDETAAVSNQLQSQQKNEPNLNFPIPPDYLKHIIDKTASYVMKNGKQFEDILRTKQDNRFIFLDPNDKYHPYYMYKVTGIPYPYPTTSSNNGAETTDDKPKVFTPVSFSIKVKDEASVSIKPAALPQETSDDDDESESGNKIMTTTQTASNQNSQNNNNNNENSTNINPITKIAVPEHVQRAIQLVESQLMNRGAQYAAAAIATAAAVVTPTTTVTSSMNTFVTSTIGRGGTNKESFSHQHQKSRFDVDNRETAITNRSSSIIPQPPPSSSSLPLGKFEHFQQKELKRAEEKVKDKLAQIAREKLGLISKEKQLQLDRKKKAMAFLNQIKHTGAISSSSNTSTSSVTVTTKSIKPEENIRQKQQLKIENDLNSDSDTSSVHSIPISSPNENNDDHGGDVGGGNAVTVSVAATATGDDRISSSFNVTTKKYHHKSDLNLEYDRDHHRYVQKARSRSSRNIKDKLKVLSSSSSSSTIKVNEKRTSRSRSRSESKHSSSTHKSKKKKSKHHHHHSKKKSKKKSRSRSRSRSCYLSKVAATTLVASTTTIATTSTDNSYSDSNRQRQKMHSPTSSSNQNDKKRKRHSTPSRKSKKKKKDQD